eukprot:gene319-344_t
MEHLKAVRSLSVNYHLLPPNISAPCFHYLPLTLRSLSIESVKSFSLPDEHQLKEIIIKNCKDILLENMENIPFVYIYHCSSIRDWIPLQNNENVMIYSDVEYDLDLKQLYNIKNLKIELNYLSRYINLSYITHLILKDSPNYFHFDVEKVLMNAKQLKELEFEIETETYTVHGCKFVNFLEHLEVLERAVTSLKIENPNYATTEDVPILRYTSFPSTLKSLHFKHSKLFYQIPAGHSLRELLIEDCPRFSLANIENIPSLTVHNCHQITDWNPLSEISNISMGCSPDFIPFQVENVKVVKMEMTLRAFSNCIDLQNITHLKLFPQINSVHPVFIERLTATSLLKELEIEVDRTSPEIKTFVSSLKQLTHIPRIVMSIFFTNRYTEGFIDFYRLTVSELKDYFALEAFSTSSKIVLLPKINHKGVEKKLNCQTL